MYIRPTQPGIPRLYNCPLFSQAHRTTGSYTLPPSPPKSHHHIYSAVYAAFKTSLTSPIAPSNATWQDPATVYADVIQAQWP